MKNLNRMLMLIIMLSANFAVLSQTVVVRGKFNKTSEQRSIEVLPLNGGVCNIKLHKNRYKIEFKAGYSYKVIFFAGSVKKTLEIDASRATYHTETAFLDINFNDQARCHALLIFKEKKARFKKV